MHGVGPETAQRKCAAGDTSNPKGGMNIALTTHAIKALGIYYEVAVWPSDFFTKLACYDSMYARI